MSETLSVKWLKQAQNSVNQDPSFRIHGNVDTKMALKVGRSTYLISFEGFSCHGVQKIKQPEQREADFVVAEQLETGKAVLRGEARRLRRSHYRQQGPAVGVDPGPSRGARPLAFGAIGG